MGKWRDGTVERFLVSVPFVPREKHVGSPDSGQSSEFFPWSCSSRKIFPRSRLSRGFESRSRPQDLRDWNRDPDIAAGQPPIPGWISLCEFLNEPIRRERFPHENMTSRISFLEIQLCDRYYFHNMRLSSFIKMNFLTVLYLYMMIVITLYPVFYKISPFISFLIIIICQLSSN